MTHKPFRVVTADPPWGFDDKLPGPGRGAVKHYATMTPTQILAYLPGLECAGVPLAPDCVLLLWRVSAMVSLAYRVVDAWGFREKSELVWRKLTRTGQCVHFGMGRSVRLAHEVAIIAHRGRPQVLSHSIRSVFDAPVGRHSAKPDEFYELVEQLYPGPYLELFARQPRSGWTCMGDEVGLKAGRERGAQWDVAAVPGGVSL